MTFDVVEGDDRTVTVTVSGELDITNVEALGSAVAPAIEHEPRAWSSNVRELRFADSSAIALWVQWATEVPKIELRDASSLATPGRRVDGAHRNAGRDTMRDTRTFPHEPAVGPGRAPVRDERTQRRVPGDARGGGADGLRAGHQLHPPHRQRVRPYDHPQRAGHSGRGHRPRRRRAHHALARADRPERPRAEDHRHAVGRVGRAVRRLPGKTVWFTISDAAPAVAGGACPA